MSYNNGDFGETSSTAGMFSYPSSPLFEQPFSNRDFFAEQTPLRSRGNVGGGNTGYGENDAFFAASNPFTNAANSNNNNARRKRSIFAHAPSPDRWVKYLMRFVLLSPLIVLVIWSVCALLFTSSHRRQTMAAAAAAQPRAQAGLIVQPKFAQASLRENIKEGILEGVEVVSEALGDAQPQGIQPLQAVTPMMGSTQQQEQMQPMQSSSSSVQQQQAAPLLQVQEQQPMGEAVQVQAPMQQQVGVQQAPLEGSILPQMLQQNKNTKSTSRAANLVQKVEDQVQRVENFLVAPKSGSSQQMPPQQLAQQQQAPAAQLRGTKRVVYYYYDPRDTSIGPQGQVILPSILYDEAGNAMASSQIQQASKVYLQPPLYGSTGSDSSSAAIPVSEPLKGTSSRTYNHPNTVTERVHHTRSSNKYGSTGSSSSTTTEDAAIPVMDPLMGTSSRTYAHPNTVTERVHHTRSSNRRGISMPTKESFNNAVLRVEQQEGGSSVIVATVAVMALLVGAISARKLRGAGALANCIENEKLDHVAAYDTATESNTAYSTFHWKGDLEKFDV